MVGKEEVPAALLALAGRWRTNACTISPGRILRKQ
jgi:hypothetical protein